MIRVVLADDQHLIRSGLRTILAVEGDIDVVAEAENGRQAAASARAAQADVVLMDVEMPGTDGIEGVRLTRAARPTAKVVMLTMFDLDEHVFGALRAGASGFLLKTATPQEIIQAVRCVHGGGQLFGPTVTHRLIDTYLRRAPATPGTPEALSTLTARELEVFGHLARGASNAEIAEMLYLSETTVKTHVARILAKLGLPDRVHAVVLAYECGWVVPGA
ncbi:response regulator [Nocardioides sambongensis]|uniref:response regulator n=1 Tax=Nocardioides sambongensis TaxID=2589074 RepID=UPI0011292539|nr:response regulator transcription factor [Nocardioides sambongensis]